MRSLPVGLPAPVKEPAESASHTSQTFLFLSFFRNKDVNIYPKQTRKIQRGGCPPTIVLILTDFDHLSSTGGTCATILLDMSSSSDSGNSSIDVLADEEREDIPTPSTPDDNEYFNDELPHTTTRNMVNRDPKRPLISAASTRKPSAYRAVADLGNYIEECYYKNTSSPRRPIFNKGAGHFTPQLEQNRKNRIIIYPGCFNPPHRNHQALLNRAFSCTQDIHVIAAIVLPLTNDTKSHMTIKFTKAEKARLWTGDYAPHDWLWVYQKSHSEWDEFRTSLARAITTDGFKLQFILLTGSDHVRRDSFPDTWDCENVVVGDVGRKADFVRADGSLARVDGCGSWALLPFNQKNITWKAKDTAEWLLGSLSFTMVGQGESNSNSRVVFH